MDINSGLTSNQVQILLKSLKNMETKYSSSQTIMGRINDNYNLVDYDNDIEYIFHRYRSPMEPNRFSLHVRFKSTEQMLVRLDINNGTHRNPDGQKIAQNHVHIYNLINGTLNTDAIAIPLPKEFIDHIDNIFSAVEKFAEQYFIELS